MGGFLPHYTGNICISVYRLNIHETFRCREDPSEEDPPLLSDASSYPSTRVYPCANNSPLCLYEGAKRKSEWKREIEKEERRREREREARVAFVGVILKLSRKQKTLYLSRFHRFSGWLVKNAVLSGSKPMFRVVSWLDRWNLKICGDD